MDIDLFLKDYQLFLEANSDSLRAKKEKQYLYSDMKHYGVKFGKRREFSNRYRKDLKNLLKAEMLMMVGRFWEQPSFEERMMALDILSMHAGMLNLNDMVLVERLIREAKGWALLDNFVMQVMAEILTNYPESYAYLHSWIEDDDYWVRRTSLLSQLLLFRNNTGDVELFFELAASQFDENWITYCYAETESRKRARFFVRKAIGWTLREMSKYQTQVVYDFLKKYKAEMSGLSFREGKRNLPIDMQFDLEHL